MPVAHLQVVVGTAVVALNLGVRGSVSRGPSGGQGPTPRSPWRGRLSWGQLGHERITGSLTYLEGLEGEAHVEALGHLDAPDADFAGPVIIWVIGRLDVTIVLFHISPADGFGDTVLGGKKGRSVRMLCLAQESLSPLLQPFPHAPSFPVSPLPIPLGSLLVPEGSGSRMLGTLGRPPATASPSIPS